MKEKTIQEEIEQSTEKLFEKIDKILEKEWGKICPEFELDCIQCRVHLAYNKFKDEVWQKHVRSESTVSTGVGGN